MSKERVVRGVTGLTVERVASECDLYGHDYQVKDAEPDYFTEGIDREPGEVFCPRCGLSWKVER